MALFAILIPGCKSNNNNSKAPEITLFEKGDNNAHLQEAEKETEAIRFHYHRKNDDGSRSVYRKWQIWAWDITNGGNGSAHTFTHYDDYGVYVDINLSDINDKPVKLLGFIVAITSDWTKDVGVDRDIEVPEKDANKVISTINGLEYKGREVRCNDADEAGHGRNSGRSERRGSGRKGDRHDRKNSYPKGGKKEDWRDLINKAKNVKFKDNEPDFSEEGWAIRRPRKGNRGK